jgi:DNA-binding NarL/FixJ family response regulator
MHHESITAHSYRVYLVEDSELVRDRLRRLLETLDNVRVVGTATNPRAALDGILAAVPNLVVIDMQLEGGNGLEVLQGLARAGSAAVRVIFANAVSAPVSQASLAAGAKYVLDKTTELRTLLQTVQSLAQAQSSNSSNSSWEMPK